MAVMDGNVWKDLAKFNKITVRSNKHQMTRRKENHWFIESPTSDFFNVFWCQRYHRIEASYYKRNLKTIAGPYVSPVQVLMVQLSTG